MVDELDLRTIDSTFFVAGQKNIPPCTAPAVGGSRESVLSIAGVIGCFGTRVAAIKALRLALAVVLPSGKPAKVKERIC